MRACSGLNYTLWRIVFKDEFGNPPHHFKKSPYWHNPQASQEAFMRPDKPVACLAFREAKRGQGHDRPLLAAQDRPQGSRLGRLLQPLGVQSPLSGPRQAGPRASLTAKVPGIRLIRLAGAASIGRLDVQRHRDLISIFRRVSHASLNTCHFSIVNMKPKILGGQEYASVDEPLGGLFNYRLDDIIAFPDGYIAVPPLRRSDEKGSIAPLRHELPNPYCEATKKART